MFTLTGILKVKNDTQQVSEKFRKREFVITDNSMYPQDVLFQLTQERTDLLDSYEVNQTINVSFNIRGREWTSPTGEVKYFNSLDVWKIDSTSNGVNPTPAEIKPSSSETVETIIEEGDDDLPF